MKRVTVVYLVIAHLTFRYRKPVRPTEPRIPDVTFTAPVFPAMTKVVRPMASVCLTRHHLSCRVADAAECQVPVTVTLEDSFTEIPICPAAPYSPPSVPYFFSWNAPQPIQRVKVTTTMVYVPTGRNAKSMRMFLPLVALPTMNLSAIRIEIAKPMNCLFLDNTCQPKPSNCVIGASLFTDGVNDAWVECCVDDLDATEPYRCEGYQQRSCTCGPLWPLKAVTP